MDILPSGAQPASEPSRNLPVLVRGEPGNGSASNQDPHPTICQLIALYNRLALPQLALATQRIVHDTLVLFAARFGAMRGRDLRPLDMEEWLAGHPTWNSGWTRQRIIATCKRVFDWAWGMELIDRNPIRFVTAAVPGPGRPLNDFEFRTLLKAVTADFRLILFFLKVTGCRPGELCALTWNHIDWQRRVIVLPCHKTRKPRVIALSQTAWKILLFLGRRTPEGLREHILILAESEQGAAKLSRLLPARHSPRREFVFLNTRGQPWMKSALDICFYRAAKAAGLPKNARLYGLRHTFVSQAKSVSRLGPVE